MVQAGIITTLSPHTRYESLVPWSILQATLHQRRGDLSKRGDRSNDNRREKSIGFADNLEMLGRWNDDLRENERTQNVLRGRKHPNKGVEMCDWSEVQREIPYAWRFNKPFNDAWLWW